MGVGLGDAYSIPPPPEKILNLDPPKKMFGQEMAFFENLLTNPRDFHKSAVKFHEILNPPPPLNFP